MSIIDAFTNILTSQANRNFDKRESELAYSRSIANRDYENRYNDPSAQMARLKAAKLNPNLIYGTPQPAGISKAQPKYEQPKSKLHASGFGELSQFQSLEQGKATINLTKAETALKDGELGLQDQDRQLKGLTIEEQSLRNSILRATGRGRAESGIASTLAGTRQKDQLTNQSKAQTASIKAATEYTNDRSLGQRLANDYQQIVNAMARDGIMVGDNKFFRTFWDYFRDNDSEMRRRNHSFYENALNETK